MKTKNIPVTLLAAAAAFAAVYYGGWLKPLPVPPSDLRDAVADDDSMGQLKGNREAIAVPEVKGYVVGNDPSAGAPGQAVEFVSIPGGKFVMGTDENIQYLEDAKPIHEVTIKTFKMSKTAVTVEQYAECVIKGKCTAPAAGRACNWGVAGRQKHPVNCVDYNQAQAYAKFIGARLPSEAEFEYAATSGGKNQKYPWGNEAPTSELAVFNTNSTMPVCSKPKGNTAQGLCDMSGNVYQWVQDVYQKSYNGAPADGSAYEGDGSYRVIRGGSFNIGVASYLRADNRLFYDPARRVGSLGFRLARSGR